mmetsp:Transcript_48321/g.156213  ORF Transcript_48321/g.156213 Transcript_48321/m.156213 type:complete len:578 (+) Transcript_48321:42-1775(+)
MGAATRVRSAHFFKKVPKEITEGTWLGGVVSITGVLVTALLVASLTQTYRTATVKTELMLDRPADSTVDVSFNITMERLPCRFASVDLFDETGTKRLNITLSIRKTRLSALDGSHLPDAAPEVWTDEPGEVAALAGEAGGEVGRQLSSTDGVVPVLTSFPDPAVAAARSAKGASGDAPPCVDLDESCPSWAKGGECDKNANYMHKNCAKACGVCDPGVEAPPDPPAGTVSFDDYLLGKELSLVAFGAPWCPWSRKMEPVLEEAHELVQMDGLLSQTVGIARVDCTHASSRELCKRMHISAFPTVRIYRHHNEHSHEEYEGERSAEALVEFLHEAIDMHEEELGWHPLTHLTHISGEGCEVSGRLRVSRVPGTLRISAQSHLHSFDPLSMNVTHHVDSFLFLEPGDDAGERLHLSDAARFWRTVPRRDGAARTMHHSLGVIDGGHGVGESQLRRETFVMHRQATTLKHFLKVVPTRSVMRAAPAPLDSYQYSTTFNEFSPHEAKLAMHVAGEDLEPRALVPQTVFSYDISPLRVVHRQAVGSFGDYLTQLCAVVGGVFTVFGLIDNVIHAGVKAAKQD